MRARGILGLAGLAIAVAAVAYAYSAWSSSTGSLSQQAKTGHDLVNALCSRCHAVEKTGNSPMPEAPPFRTLHERYDVSLLSEALVEGLVSGHPDMPEFNFEPNDAEAIIVYLKTLE